MTIKTFIEKAIEGGYKIRNLVPQYGQIGGNGEFLDGVFVGKKRDEFWIVDTLLLDPKLWQAVGKVEGWGSGCNICLKDGITHSYANGWADECENPKEHLTGEHKYPWQVNMHRFIDALAEGKTIEQFLETL